MFCSSCGNAVESGVRFCPNCGAAPIQKSSPAPAGVPRIVIVAIAVVLAFVFLIVVGIVAAIALPQILRSRSNEAELRAIQSIQQLHTAQASFRAQNGRYAESLDELGPLIPSDLAAGASVRYRFHLTGDGTSYSIQAETLDGRGPRLYSDQTTAIRLGPGPPSPRSVPSNK
jgi:type II secretory pathway pseudopilin PulG